MKSGLGNIMSKLDDRDWFAKALDEIHVKGKKPRKQIDYFYASWAGDCIRAIQYNMNGLMPDDIDAQSQRRMDNGNYMHTRYGDYFKSIEGLVEEEPAFKQDMDGVFVSGRSDLILLDDNKKEFLAELKSINDRKYKLILLQPDEGDFLQWNLCAKALGFTDGIILYENKNDQSIKYHFVKYNEDKYKQVINDFILIDTHNKAGTLVPKPAVCVNSQWCSMRKECK
jgi:hypothetical protein